MRWFKRRSRPGTQRASDNADVRHLEQFTVRHVGVEGFVEPPTAVTGVTLMLVANDGQWTRRRVPSAQWAHEWANRKGVPSYDASVVGYPSRMREWNHRKAAEQRDAGDA
jgi:hypothetical protein